MSKKLKVLIVDDSGIVVKRLHNLLSEIQEVECIGHAAHYADAMTMIENGRPDVLLLDIKLPKKNGVEVLIAVKSRHKKVTVIMLSNFSDTYYRDLCFNSGCDYFLDKSNEFDKIESTLIQIINRGTAQC